MHMYATTYAKSMVLWYNLFLSYSKMAKSFDLENEGQAHLQFCYDLLCLVDLQTHAKHDVIKFSSFWAIAINSDSLTLKIKVTDIEDLARVPLP